MRALLVAVRWCDDSRLSHFTITGLTHSVSVALTGSQIFSDAIRVAIHKELRDHRDHYLKVGHITQADRDRFSSRLQAEALRSTQGG